MTDESNTCDLRATLPLPFVICLAGQVIIDNWRRLHVLLEREGVHLNHKKLRRLYRKERLQVRRRGGRKPALSTRAPLALNT